MAVKIEKETIIGDVLDIAPQSAPLFFAIGMHCLGCPSSRGETVEEACMVHGIDCDSFLAQLNHFLEAYEADQAEKQGNRFAFLPSQEPGMALLFGGLSMNIPLSPRLQVCAGFVPRGSRVADVGCDHGYLSIYLLTQGIASSVIASDIGEMPLLSAVRNAEKFGVRDQISFFLSDGVRSIPRDFDALVCAGMGADTMISILAAAPWLKDQKYTLILQCQSKTPVLRQFLSENGWRIAEESVVRDGKFLYTVMEVWWQPDHPRLTVGEWYFPPALLENPGEALPEYYRYVREGLRIATRHQSDPEKEQALQELETLAQSVKWLTEVTP